MTPHRELIRHMNRVKGGGRGRSSIRGPFRETAFDYANNLIVSHELGSSFDQLVEELVEYRIVREVVGIKKAESASRAHRAKFAQYLRTHEARVPRTPGTPIGANLTRFGEIFGLDELDVQIFTFLMIRRDNRMIGAMLDAGSESEQGRFLAMVLAQPLDKVVDAIAPNGRLYAAGVLEECSSNAFEDARPRGALMRIICDAEVTREKLTNEFLPELTARPEQWLEHRHLTDEIEIAAGILARAHARGTPGVHVLLHGPTGTGKSELACALARRLGQPLFGVGVRQRDDDHPGTSDRVSSLLMGVRLVRAGAGLMLFDEFEDMFNRDVFSMMKSGSSSKLAKQTFNELLETTPVPIIWTSNSIAAIDPAFLRRFCYAIEVKPAGWRQRRAILAHHATALAPDELTQLATRFVASPAHLTSAVRAAALLSDDATPHAPAIASVLTSTTRLGRGALSRPVFDPTQYLLDSLNASIDLGSLVEQLARSTPEQLRASGGVSMCLYGPSGTGKSELVHYLAHRLDRTVVARRGSDLLGMFLGETEKNMARAFDEARSDDAILLIDEADSFLRDRTLAQRSWEVSICNEMLQQMEAFPGIVVMTTNLWDSLDAAVLRRFTIKVELRPMTAPHARALFWTMFGGFIGAVTDEETAAVDARLAKATLTPGDMRCVQRRQTLLADQSALGIAAEVVAESRVRDRGGRAIGFGGARPGLTAGPQPWSVP